MVRTIARNDGSNVKLMQFLRVPLTTGDVPAGYKNVATLMRSLKTESTASNAALAPVAHI